MISSISRIIYLHVNYIISLDRGYKSYLGVFTISVLGLHAGGARDLPGPRAPPVRQSYKYVYIYIYIIEREIDSSADQGYGQSKYGQSKPHVV